MNISDLINDIKFTEGLNTTSIPFREPAETVMMKGVEVAVRTFSRIKPLIKEYDEHIDNLKKPEGMQQGDMRRIFLLPPALTTTPVSDAYGEYLSGVNYAGDSSELNAFTVGSPFVGFGSYYPQDNV